MAALTARQALFEHGRLKHGQRVLVHGAAGGVGTSRGAIRGMAWRGGDRHMRRADLDFVRGLGARHVIDYKEQRFEEETGDFDLVVDLIGMRHANGRGKPCAQAASWSPRWLPRNRKDVTT